jgi:hypothetical protein
MTPCLLLKSARRHSTRRIPCKSQILCAFSTTSRKVDGSDPPLKVKLTWTSPLCAGSSRSNCSRCFSVRMQQQWSPRCTGVFPETIPPFASSSSNRHLRLFATRARRKFAARCESIARVFPGASIPVPRASFTARPGFSLGAISQWPDGLQEPSTCLRLCNLSCLSWSIC